MPNENLIPTTPTAEVPPQYVPPSQQVQQSTPQQPIQEPQVKVTQKRSPVEPIPSTMPIEQPKPAQHIDTPDISEAEFKDDKDPEDITPPDQDTLDVDAVISEQAAAVNNGEIEVKNTEKMPLAMPLSTLDKLDAAKTRILTQDPNKAGEQMSDMVSPFSSMERSQRQLDNQFGLQTDALKMVPEPLKDHLKRSKGGVGDADASLSSRYKNQTRIELTDSDAFMTMATVTGGMRKVTLWNSGFSVTLRKLPLSLLNNYYNAANTRDYEYGREFGAFYYHFADLAIKEHIIENLLPAAICSSSYAHWRDTDKLLSAISVQDFPTIVWAMSCMMHPSGASVHFACGEENCDHVEVVTSDLTKLRLLNTDLITEDMVDHFKNNRLVTDEALQAYREKTKHLNKVITVEYGEDLDWRKWDIHLRQISLADHVAIGRDFNAELQKNVRATNHNDVSEYTTYNISRSYKPWIEKIEMTFHTQEGDKTLVLKNNGTPNTDSALYLALETISQNADLDELMKNYIISTMISHIVFYMPECPKCHKPPTVGYHGYVPFDPMRNFFTLALMKLLQAFASRASSNSQQNSENS